MGRIKKYLEDWLENYGYDLGYDMNNCPDFVDWNVVKRNKIDAFTYYNNKKAIEQEELRRQYGFPEPEVEDE